MIYEKAHILSVPTYEMVLRMSCGPWRGRKIPNFSNPTPNTLHRDWSSWQCLTEKSIFAVQLALRSKNTSEERYVVSSPLGLGASSKYITGIYTSWYRCSSGDRFLCSQHQTYCIPHSCTRSCSVSANVVGANIDVDFDQV